jgi:hypothetical protein
MNIEWVYVEDRLPEIMRWCLVSRKYRNGMRVIFTDLAYFGVGGEWLDANAIPLDDPESIYAWGYIPNPAPMREVKP